jgi:hypothetical protein
VGAGFTLSGKLTASGSKGLPGNAGTNEFSSYPVYEFSASVGAVDGRCTGTWPLQPGNGISVVPVNGPANASYATWQSATTAELAGDLAE